jgi:hypothetical protein
MNKRFQVCRFNDTQKKVSLGSFWSGESSTYELIFIDCFFTEQEAIDYISSKGDNWCNYTILPIYTRES